MYFKWQSKGNSNNVLRKQISNTRGHGVTKKKKGYSFNNRRSSVRSIRRSQVEPERKSRRLRGQEPSIKMKDDPESRENKETEDKENKNIDNNDYSNKVNYSENGNRDYDHFFSRNAIYKVRENFPYPDVLCVPVTLCSIGVTVLDLGTIYVGENPGMYWSNAGCKYLHPYPIGYKASKFHFGRHFDMEIVAGDEDDEDDMGPTFRVKDTGRGIVYEGKTPTQPWTKVCINSSSPGTRISGPLYFGFSDPLVQKMIRDLKNFNTYEADLAKTQKRRMTVFPFMKHTNQQA